MHKNNPTLLDLIRVLGVLKKIKLLFSLPQPWHLFKLIFMPLVERISSCMDVYHQYKTAAAEISLFVAVVL